ncbi:MAG: SDR family oxidoreductase [Firmicutes bacterium]|jgi:NAD(P)-dependent dehydrogenase (short-subunit alcohol dehydrogenase family)|nr:SDR family oxidoreductase [Bacillota bacterium]
MILQGKVAMITGGGKGIGRAISQRLAREGADLVLLARTAGPLEEVAGEARSLGRRALVLPGDASQEKTVEEAVNQAIATFGKVDILVNNTGIEGPNSPIEGISLADWDHTMAVNLTSAFLCCKQVIPHMRSRKQGSIINISSLAGTRGIINRSPYCASKWAMIGMAKAVAWEVGPDNIRVNVICPGAVEGERIERVMHKRARDHGLTYEEMVAKTTSDTPLRRFVTPEEIAATALFLASDESAGITGEVIIVSGGRR